MAGITISLSTSMGSASASEGPCISCTQDPACIGNPQVKTVQNFLSVCRIGHGIFFLAYALLMIIVIVLVWLASNGSISTTVNAWVSTLISIIVLVLMFFHWFLYIKG